MISLKRLKLALMVGLASSVASDPPNSFGQAAKTIATSDPGAVAPGRHPAISGDGRFDRVLAFEGGDGHIYVAENADPTVNAAHPWRTTHSQSLVQGSDPDVDGEPGKPPVPPRCVAYLDPSNQPSLAKLNGQARRLAADYAFDVAIDGACTHVAWGGTGGLYVEDLKAHKHKLYRTTAPVVSVDYSIRINRANDRIAYESGNVVYVRDLVAKRTLTLGPGHAPAISEQGHVVAYQRNGAIIVNGTWQHGLGRERNALDDPLDGDPLPGYPTGMPPNASADGGPSVGAGGSVVAYAASGDAYLWTDVRDLNLLASRNADRTAAMSPASDVVVSTRGNEVFFEHDGWVFARYLGPK